MVDEQSLRVVDPLGAEWVTLLLLAAVAVLAWVNISAPKQWRLLAQAMFRMRLGRQALRDEVDLQDRTFIALLGTSVAVLTLFGWQTWVLRMPAPPPSYPLLLGLVALVLVAQVLQVRLVAWLFQGDGGLDEYLTTGLLLLILLGMALLPLAVFVAFRPGLRPWALLAGSALVAALLLYRWVRGVWIGRGEGVSPGYIILYLCAAEAVPLLLLIHGLRTPIDHP